jgi:hypothetical protein
MGLFDTFIAHCPCCGTKVKIQSKLFDYELAEFKPGDKVAVNNLNYTPGTTDSDDFTTVEFKTNEFDKCKECGAILTVCIRHGRFRGFLYDH